MKNYLIKKLVYLLSSILVLGITGAILSRLITILSIRIYSANQRIYEIETVPKKDIVIVFGAGLRRDGSPTSVLRDRIEIATNLYHLGKVKKILMSGDNRTIHYNEPESMRQYALELGVPEKDIVLDYAGLRTYDTCFRANQIFDIHDAILVTQDFHMPRALYTCTALGVKSVGVTANLHVYSRQLLTFWNLREMFASLVALWDLNISKPLPILGNPEPIFTNDLKGDAL